MNLRAWTFLVVLLSLIVACRSSTVELGSEHATGMYADEVSDSKSQSLAVSVRQTAAPPVLRSGESVSLTFEFTMRNRLDEPVRVNHILLETMGGGNVTIPRISRPFDAVIAPGEEAKLDFWARGNVRRAEMGSDGPMILRATVRFDRGEETLSEVYVRRTNGRGGIGVGNS